MKEENQKKIGRPKKEGNLINADKKLLHIFVSKELHKKVKHYCTDNNTTHRELVESVLQEFFNKNYN